MVMIRNWQLEDAFIFHTLSMDPYYRLKRFKQYLYPDTFFNTISILETYQNADHKKFRIQAILNEHTVCGFIQFEKKDESCGEISYWIGRLDWHKGIASLAVQQMCQQIFHDFSIICIYARVKEDNIASQKVLQHNHFTCVSQNQGILIYERYK